MRYGCGALVEKHPPPFLRESMKIYVEWEIRFPGVLIHRLLKDPIKLEYTLRGFHNRND